MKRTNQCLIITAYNNYELVEKSVLYYSKFMDCYIHMDKKNYSDYWYKRLSLIEGCYVFSIYKIKWGSINHVKSILYILNQATNYEYYHVIPENSMIVVSMRDFLSFFDNNNFSYIDCGTINNRLMDRLIYRYYLDIFNLRGNKIVRNISMQLMNFVVLIQKKFNLKRKLQFTYKFKGYLYCDLSSEYVSSMLNFINDNPQYIKELKNSFVGEEFFFQNISVNIDKDIKIKRKSLTYDIWDEKRGFPAILNTTDFQDIKNSDKLYARKIDLEFFEKYSRDING